jgi:hypothetical protein
MWVGISKSKKLSSGDMFILLIFLFDMLYRPVDFSSKLRIIINEFNITPSSLAWSQ